MSAVPARLQRVHDYIEANLDQPLDIMQLSQLAHWSKYHFHRQFHAAFGVNVATLISQLRLKRAAYQLAYRPQLSVTNIALQSGYASNEAFSRAFQRLAGQSPSQFRKAADWPGWQQRLATTEQRSPMMPQPYPVAISDMAAIPLAVLEHHGAPALLGQTIQRFISWRRANKLPPARARTFNLLYDDPAQVAPDDYQFDLACEYHAPLTAADSGMLSKTLPAGSWAKLRYTGNEQGLALAVQYLYSQWLPASGYQLRDFPLVLERISFFPDVAECQAITDIYLPLV